MATPEQQRARALVAEHLDTLFRVACRLMQNVPDAQDLVQDTCVAAAENLRRLSAMDTTLHWLLHVMRNRRSKSAASRRSHPRTGSRSDRPRATRAAESPST